ncbi:MAG: DNA mismatch repair protein MutS [Pseudomonadota bacterium]
MADGTSQSSQSSKKANKAPSPFLAQYLEIKADHADALLFFRMGDFYELFFQDAIDAAEILGITLTARGEYQGEPIPMAGVPFHAAEGYLSRLIASGRRIAVCEQTESPAEAKKRGSKAIVNREIVRIVTPGTITEDALLPAKESNALAAIGVTGGGRDIGVAVCDVSTGAFELFQTTPATLADTLGALPLREVLVGDGDLVRETIIDALDAIDVATTPRPQRIGKAKDGEAALKQSFKVASIDAFGQFSKAELSAASFLLEYLNLTQAGADIQLDPPRTAAPGRFVAIDPATRTSLEIERSVSGTREGSLLATVDRTLTAPGARLLADRLARPSADLDTIQARHDAISWFLEEPDLCEDIRSSLKAAPDMERARGRLRLGRGGPKDLKAIGVALRRGEDAASMVARRMARPAPLIDTAIHHLTLANCPALGTFANNLEQAIADNVPTLTRDGNFIMPGWDKALDQARTLRDDARKIIAGLQADYAGETGIAALKIKFNNVLGYFIEVTARNAEPLMADPLNARFIHRQTLSNVVRFSTTELSELAGRISRAEEEARAREIALFDDFVSEMETLSAPLQTAAAALADLDVAAANAVWANEIGACRPELVETPDFAAEGLRHPVVEAALKKTGGGFTANTTQLDATGANGPRLQLVTGPNMAGKSTYLRQCALAVILAQAGCFVPARSLRLGLADRVFSRVGASDDLARGRSTFMVEMVETAAILTQASAASFVILDEVGRGTSTYDGLAIAWAAVEHLHGTNGCRALFATHYHELTELAGQLPHATNVSLRAKDWKDELIFLHDVQAGPADRSYGVQVARLAGLPKSAVRRAEQVLKRLEADPNPAENLPLFASLPAEPVNSGPSPSPLNEAIAGIDPDTLTPREALDLVYELKRLNEDAPG